jgi:hypothetical protein
MVVDRDGAFRSLVGGANSSSKSEALAMDVFLPRWLAEAPGSWLTDRYAAHPAAQSAAGHTSKRTSSSSGGSSSDQPNSGANLPAKPAPPPEVGGGYSLRFLVGSHGSALPLATHNEAVNALVYGKKHWVFFNGGGSDGSGSSSSSGAGDGSSSDGSSGGSRSSTPPGYPVGDGGHHKWLAAVLPTLAPKERPLQCVQMAGDAIYVPEVGHPALFCCAPPSRRDELCGCSCFCLYSFLAVVWAGMGAGMGWR